MLVKRLLLGFILATLITGLVACGGSSGGGGGAASSVEISGVATAPGGTVALLENHGALYAVGHFLMPGAHAGITGLQPVTGATVELIEVDANGVQVGSVLATTSTSITGDYRLTLPQGVNLAANLIVRITGAGGINLRAQVVEQTVDISPVTEFVLQKLIGAGLDLTTLATNEVVTLTGEVEQYDLTAGADMTQMLAALETEVGGFIDDQITTIDNGLGDASTVAGDFHLGGFGLALHDTDDSSFGNFVTSVEVGMGTMTDAGNGAITGTLTDSVDTWGNLWFGSTGATGLSLDTEVSVTPDTFSGSVDGLGAVIIDIPFEEELEPVSNIGWRIPPLTIRLEPVGTTGVHIGRDSEGAVRYSLVDTDGDGTLDALDPTARLGDVGVLGILITAPKSQGLTAASVSGDYGSVGMAVESQANGTTVTGAFFSVERFDGSGNVTETSFDEAIITRTASGASITTSSDTFTENSTYTVAADGTLTVTEGGITDVGLVGDGGNILAVFTLYSIDDGGTPPTITSFTHEVALGVKLPASLPDMTGRGYRLFSLDLNYAGSATLVEALTKGQILFNGDGTVNITDMFSRGIERPSDVGNIMPVTDTIADVNNQSVSIGTNGSIAFTAGTDTFDGFVSADGKMLLLRKKSDGGANDQAVGMIIGILN